MNAYMGADNPAGLWQQGMNDPHPDSQQRVKLPQIDSPSKRFVTIEEQADSINDGWFDNELAFGTVSFWGDTPATYHNGSGTLSFGDGHAESHHWISNATAFPVTTSGYNP